MENQTQNFSFFFWNYLLILKILPVPCFKDPTNLNSDLKLCLLYFQILSKELRVMEEGQFYRYL